MGSACSLPQGESQRDTATPAEQTDSGFAPIERGVQPGQVANVQPTSPVDAARYSSVVLPVPTGAAYPRVDDAFAGRRATAIVSALQVVILVLTAVTTRSLTLR